LKRVYISHPFKGDKQKNFEEVNNICISIANTQESVLPVSPLHMFSFLDDDNPVDRERAMCYCLNLLNDCDEVWVFGDWEKSEGCKKEINMARLLNKTLRFWGKLAEESKPWIQCR